MTSWQYQFEAVSVDGFVEQLVRYVNTGHYFYVTGRVPDGKLALTIDKKLLNRYEISQPRWQRARRKQAGVASVHYLRFEDRFILLATHGQHAFFDSHSAEQIQDCRRTGIKFGGYSIRRTCCVRTRKWHTLVRLDKPTYVALRAYLLELALRRDQETLEDEFRSICFQPYRPVREQLLAILRAVNRRRKTAGLAPLDYRCVRSRRRITKPFGESISDDPVSSSVYSTVAATGSTDSGRMRPSSKARDSSSSQASAR
jgi:hypothetical protein